LASVSTDAVFGPALDGGWWSVGMVEPDPSVFVGIPTSRPDTGARQRAALARTGRRIVDLAPQRDVDTWDDVGPAAAAAPHGQFARVVAGLGERVA
ncbi:MAG TPA: DUF2064 domain-containing protein, partial [Acidimicrobiales bacterium]